MASEEEDHTVVQRKRSLFARCSRLKMAVAGTVAGVFLVALIAAICVGTTVAFVSNTPHSPLKVAAFNIKSFGVTKMSHTTVANRIVQILERYDLVLIQEVRDSRQSSLHDLEDLLDARDDWSYVSSHPIGRTTYKEQYVFFYRADKVRVTGQYQYDDSAHDYYEREPFAVEIQYYSSSKSSFRYMALVGLHTRPADTPAELRLLPGVMKAVSGHFSRADGVIAMGDFNADCNYLSSSERDSLDVFQSSKGFTSHISASVDTTVSHNTNCAYDRVISMGDVSIRNAHVFNFESGLRLSASSAADVSDHYPVEFSLY